MVDFLDPLNDRVLAPLFEAADESAREEVIGRLLDEQVRPVLTGVLARLRRQDAALQAEDAEEIASLVTLRMLAKLRATARFEEHAIASVEKYVARLAYNGVHDFRRQRHPERHRLKKALRYALMTDERLAVWNTHAGAAAGFASWQAREDVAATITIDTSRVTSARPAEAMVEILRSAQRPVLLDTLVSAIAALCNVREAVHEHDEFPPDDGRDPLATLEQRQYMETLWREIRELPREQRAALLLNLRDSSGGNALALFLLLGVAGVEELAEAMALPAAELNEIWERLPLDDLTIAARLQRSRQQVINLRKAARLRLARRMR